MPLPKGNGLSFQTNRALKDLDRDGEGKVAPPPANTWATATPLRADQTMRHPRTGQPMTPVEMEALQAAIKKRAVPQAK